MTRNPEYPLGGFDWLDRNANLRRWFATWLTSHWTEIYSGSVSELHSKADWENFDRMENAIKQLAVKLPTFPSAKQISAVDAKARKFSFKTTRDRIENELKWFLTHAGKQPENSLAFKASPWCDHFATMEHILEQTGKDIPYKLYPDDPNAQLALASVISEFGSLEILREASPAMSQLFAVQRGFDQFDKAIKSLPTESPLLSAFHNIEPGLREYSTTLQTEINRRANEPAAFFSPLRVRRLQRRIYFAVRRLCKPKDGPDKLAGFIQKLLRNWPRIYAGMELDLEEHFNADNRRKLVRDHFGLAEGQMNKEGRALWRVLNAIAFRDELRGSLLHLAHKAHQHAKQQRRGWPHLRMALRVAFSHIGRSLYVEEIMRNFERAYFSSMRNVTREQRMRLLSELGKDSDDSVRDLTLKERMILFQQVNRKLCPGFKVDPDGRDSYSTLYRRAMKAVRIELGQS